MKLSAVIITYNEEEKIGACLDSLSTVADEIIVVDSNSTDRTAEICLTKGADVFCQTFLGYAEQKNFALGKTNYDYVLSIDADEVLSVELINSIKEVKISNDYDAYEFNRLTNFCGKWIRHGGWFPDTKVRLWKKDKGKWIGDGVHETLDLADKTEVKKLNGNLFHYSIDSIEQHIDQIQKFTTLAANDMHSKGKETTVLTVILNSWFKFFRDYFVRLGFLDGFYGYVVAKNSAYAKYLKYLKLYQLNKQAKK